MTMNMWIAAADNDLAKVKEYLELPQFTPNSKDSNGYTPIHAAAEYAHVDLLKYLIEQGGDVNIKDNDGDTPLHACESVAAAHELLLLGANINAKNEEDQTPLEKAEEDGDFPELVVYLRKESGIETPDSENLPENFKMRVEPAGADGSDLPAPQVSDEQRVRFAEIIQSGNDADFEEYVKNALVAQGENVETVGEPSKKAKKSEE